MKTSANEVLSRVDELMAGLRDGDDDALAQARDLMHGLVESSDHGKMMLLMLSFKVTVEQVARRESK